MMRPVDNVFCATGEPARNQWSPVEISHCVEDQCERLWSPVDNVFCPTGEGGGVDPSCTSTRPGKRSAAALTIADVNNAMAMSGVQQAVPTSWRVRGPVSSASGRPCGKKHYCQINAVRQAKRDSNLKVVAGLAVQSDSLDPSSTTYREYKGGAVMFAHVWNEDDKGNVVDTTYGEEVARRHLYVGKEVPNEIKNDPVKIDGWIDSELARGYEDYAKNNPKEAKKRREVREAKEYEEESRTILYHLGETKAKGVLGSKGSVMSLKDLAAAAEEHLKHSQGKLDAEDRSSLKSFVRAYRGGKFGLVENQGASTIWAPVDNVFCATGEGGGIDPSCSPSLPPPTSNVFCPTGEGGGVDPSCSLGGKSSRRALVDSARAALVEHSKGASALEDRYVRLYVEHPAVTKLHDLLYATYQPIFKATLFTHTKETSNHADDFRRLRKATERALTEYPKADINADSEAGKDRGAVMKFLREVKLYAQRGLEKVEAVRGAVRKARRDKPTGNIFCPTGEGGGVDPTCSPPGSSSPDAPRNPAGASYAARSLFRKAVDVLKAAGAKISHLEHVAKRFIADRVEAAISKLSPRNQKIARKTLAVGAAGTRVAFATYSAGQAFAERVARERGLSEEQARTLRGTLATADIMAAKPATITGKALGIGGLVLIAGSSVPMASVGYLAYSTVRNPNATYRAAKGVIKEGAAGARLAAAKGAAKVGSAARATAAAARSALPKPTPAMPSPVPRRQLGLEFLLARNGWEPVDNLVEGSGDAGDDATRVLITDALAAANYDDWWVALFTAALGELGGDAAAAVEVANLAYAESQRPVRNANCGTGAGGFQPGNTCARGSGSTNSVDSTLTAAAKGADALRPGYAARVSAKSNFVDRLRALSSLDTEVFDKINNNPTVMAKLKAAGLYVHNEYLRGLADTYDSYRREVADPYTSGEEAKARFLKNAENLASSMESAAKALRHLGMEREADFYARQAPALARSVKAGVESGELAVSKPKREAASTASKVKPAAPKRKKWQDRTWWEKLFGVKDGPTGNEEHGSLRSQLGVQNDAWQTADNSDCGTGTGGFKEGNTCAGPAKASRKTGKPLLNPREMNINDIVKEAAKLDPTSDRRTTLEDEVERRYGRRDYRPAPKSKSGKGSPVKARGETILPISSRPSPTSPTKADPETILAAFRSLDKRKDNLISVADLAEETKLPLPALHSTINDLRRRGILTATGFEGRLGADERVMGAALKEYGELLSHVSIREEAKGKLRELLGNEEWIPVDNGWSSSRDNVGWVTTEEGQHIFIGEDGNVYPSGPPKPDLTTKKEKEKEEEPIPPKDPKPTKPVDSMAWHPLAGKSRQEMIQATGAVKGKARKGGRPVPTPGEMTTRNILKELDKLDEESIKDTDEMIASGRWSEKP